MTGQDRKAFSEAVEAAQSMGLMFCLIYNPAFNHFFAEFKTPDTQEAIGQAMGNTALDACTAVVMDSKRRMALMGLERYQFEETKPLVIV